jgi:hypothetical protein
MCTISFIPNKNGYLLAMNRDELKSRASAIPPSLHQSNSISLLYPQEPSGGTWIAVNSRGILLALMNANTPEGSTLPAKSVSRGEIIPALLCKYTGVEMDQALRVLPLTGMHPFRLFGIFALTHEIEQWAWDGRRLTSRKHDWVRNHWFSSSRSDSRAASERVRVCEMSWHEDIPDTRDWIRSLHSSHIPEAGPFSICVHREDAATVSYTEVDCGATEVRMSYRPGYPCLNEGTLSSVTVPLRM